LGVENAVNRRKEKKKQKDTSRFLREMRGNGTVGKRATENIQEEQRRNPREYVGTGDYIDFLLDWENF